MWIINLTEYERSWFSLLYRLLQSIDAHIGLKWNSNSSITIVNGFGKVGLKLWEVFVLHLRVHRMIYNVRLITKHNSCDTGNQKKRKNIALDALDPMETDGIKLKRNAFHFMFFFFPKRTSANTLTKLIR